MRAHYLQHVPFESLGNIEHWRQSKDYAISSIELFNPQVLPAHESELKYGDKSVRILRLPTFNADGINVSMVSSKGNLPNIFSRGDQAGASNHFSILFDVILAEGACGSKQMRFRHAKSQTKIHRLE